VKNTSGPDYIRFSGQIEHHADLCSVTFPDRLKQETGLQVCFSAETVIALSLEKLTASYIWMVPFKKADAVTQSVRKHS